MGRNYKDIAGLKFNKLTAVRFLRMKSRNDGRSNAMWLFQCDCGKKLEALGRYVERGFKKSCGCHVRRGIKVPAWNTFNKCYADGTLTFEEYCKLSQRACHYCGEPPSNKRNYHGHVYIYNGLNRISHDLPHDSDNVRPCCWKCNERICRWSEQEFLKWIQTIHNKLFGE